MSHPPRYLLLLPTLLLCPMLMAQNDIENVVVETYYVSDAADATDTTGGGLPQGAHTYRVFIDLCDSCTLRALYGRTDHPLRIASTAPFFNNADRGKTFGHLVNNSALDENTVALDSWLSLGGASNQKMGVLKADDPDGSIVGGGNNDGGSAGVSGGLLVNQDPDAGVPLTTADGLMPPPNGSVVPPTFNVLGDDPGTTFADSTVSGTFQSDSVRIACTSPGMRGPTPDNVLLVAQLTTTGDLAFQLNIEVQRADGTVKKYVALDTLLGAGETANGLLNYPPVCGCTDPTYLEYDPAAGCDDGSCQTLIVFGCLDTNACNFDPDANFNVSQLCCYGPDSCNGLDPQLVCPGVWVEDITSTPALSAYPNPTASSVLLRPGEPMQHADIDVFDAVGRNVMHRHGVALVAGADWPLDLSDLNPGTYLIHVRSGASVARVRVVRE